MNNPKFVKVDGRLYKINTDFRVALDCNKIAEDKTINSLERAMAIIYKLFGEEGLDCENQNKLIELGMKYLLLGRDKNSLKTENKDKFELDFNKCLGLIRSSFKFDYNYDPFELDYLHWYEFYNDMENLSTSEFGTCCPLNRIISILNQEPKEIKDNKSRQKLIETQKILQEKYCKKEEKAITKEQEESAKSFYKSLGIEI